MFRTLFENLYFGLKQILFFLSKKNKILEYIYNFFLIILIISCSGYGIVVFSENSYVKIIIYVLLLILLLGKYILNFDINILSRIKKNKKIVFNDVAFLYLCIMGVFIILSIIFNPSVLINLNTYIDISLILIFSYLFVSIYSFDTFVKWFIRILVFICIYSLLFFSIQQITYVNFNTGFFDSVIRSYDNYFYLFFDYTDRFYNTFFDARLMSLFWEPGFYATILLIGLVLEINFKKTNWFNVCLFIICILFTKSTAGYILLLPILFLIISKILKGKTRFFILSTILISTLFLFIFFDKIIILLSNYLPSVFGKIEEGAVSLTTRIYSPYYYFKVFLQKPFFGWGGYTANEIYMSIVPESLVDARTSTSGYVIASLGFIGFLYTILPIIGIWRLDKIKGYEKLMIMIIFICIINKENHFSILVSNIIMFYLILNIKKKKTNDSEVEEKRIYSILFNKTSEYAVIIKNTIGSFGIKLIALIIGLMALPAYSKFFGNDNTLGIWLTLISILTWILNFDLGLGNGLKNRLVQSLSKNNDQESKKLISSTYITTSFISLIILIIGILIALLFDLNALLNISVDLITPVNLKITVIILFLSIAFEFVLKNILSILQAHQKNALASSMMLITNIILIIFAFFVDETFNADRIILMAVIYFFAVNLPLLIASIMCFKGQYKKIKPSYKFFDKQLARNVMSIGSKIFVIQLTNLIIWAINNVLISNMFDPSQVVIYEKYYKIFNFVVTLMSIVQPIVWVSITKFLAENKISFIKKIIKISNSFAFILSLLSVLVALFLQIIFDLWLGDFSIQTEIRAVIVFTLYAVSYCLLSSITAICNGLETLKSMMFFTVIGAIIKIPLIILLINVFKFDHWSVVVLANVICTLPLLVFCPIEIKNKIINIERRK